MTASPRPSPICRASELSAWRAATPTGLPAALITQLELLMALRMAAPAALSLWEWSSVEGRHLVVTPSLQVHTCSSLWLNPGAFLTPFRGA